MEVCQSSNPLLWNDVPCQSKVFCFRQNFYMSIVSYLKNKNDRLKLFFKTIRRTVSEQYVIIFIEIRIFIVNLYSIFNIFNYNAGKINNKFFKTIVILVISFQRV